VEAPAIQFQGAELGKRVRDFNGKNRRAQGLRETVMEAHRVQPATGREQLGLVEEDIVASEDEEMLSGHPSPGEGASSSFDKADGARATCVMVPEGQGEEHAGTETFIVILVAVFEDIDEIEDRKPLGGEEIDHVV
jgi:hypothetical protein